MRNSRCISPKILAALTAREPLIAHYLMRSNIVETNHLPHNACAAITIDNNKITLFLNPDRFMILPELQQAGVLLHEYLHPLLGHCSSRVLKDKQYNYVLNVAQDMAINQLVVKTLEMPDYAVFHNSKEYNLLPLKSAEYYFNELMKDIPKFERSFGPLDNPDEHNSVGSHDDWKDNAATAKTIKRIGQEYSNLSNPHVGQILSGTEHADILQKITASTTSKINWITEIIQFIDSIDSENKRYTYTRPNRRYDDLPGTIKEYQSKVAVILDTSGSMAQIMPYALGEINRLSTVAEIDIYQCDVGITKVIKNHSASTAIDVKGFGGTILQPAFTAAHEDGAQAIICITDGHLGQEEIEYYDLPLIWTIYNNPTFMPSVGKLIRIET